MGVKQFMHSSERKAPKTGQGMTATLPTLSMYTIK